MTKQNRCGSKKVHITSNIDTLLSQFHSQPQQTTYSITMASSSKKVVVAAVACAAITGVAVVAYKKRKSMTGTNDAADETEEADEPPLEQVTIDNKNVQAKSFKESLSSLATQVKSSMPSIPSFSLPSLTTTTKKALSDEDSSSVATETTSASTSSEASPANKQRRSKKSKDSSKPEEEDVLYSDEETPETPHKKKASKRPSMTSVFTSKDSVKQMVATHAA